MQIVQRLREAGFDGGYKDYVSKVRPKRAPAFLTLAFAPGEAAQVDWGEYGTIPVGATRRRLSFFVMVLTPCGLAKGHEKDHGSYYTYTSCGA